MKNIIRRHGFVIFLVFCVICLVLALRDEKTNSFAIFVSLIVVVSGWAYNSRLADDRETRKELKSDMSDINKTVLEIIELCRNYKGDQQDDLRQVESRIYLIAKTSALLPAVEQFVGNPVFQQNKLESDACVDTVTLFWENVCGDNIEHDNAEHLDSTRAFQDQFYYGHLLIRKLNVLFRTCF